MTLESGAKLAYRLGTASDSVTGVGTLNLNGQVWSDFTFTDQAGFGPGTYVLIAATSVNGSLGGAVTGSIGGVTGAVSVDGNSDLILTVAGAKPTVTINQAAGQGDPTNASPINFTVVFSEAVTGFEGGDVTLGGTAGATTAVVTGGGATHDVAVSGMTGTGTVTSSLAAGVVLDLAGNASAASTSTDNEVTYSTTYTWDGSSSGAWSTGANWDTGASPSANTADVVFYQVGAGNLTTYMGTGGRTIRNLTFNSAADANVTIQMDANDGSTGRSFNFESDTGASTITVDAGAGGNFTISTTTSGGRLNIYNPLVIDHNGPGTLTIRRIRDINYLTGPYTNTVTKTGAGTLVYGNTGAYYHPGETIVLGGIFRYAANNSLYTGPVTLSGSNTYGGTTTVGDGTLLIHGYAAGATGAVTVASGATLGGTGVVGGATVVAGTVAPGASIGTLAFSNDLAFEATGVARMQIDRGPDLTNDQLAVAGTLTRGGTLAVTNAGAAPQAGDLFPLLRAGNLAGSFATLQLPALGAGLAWDTNGLALLGDLEVYAFTWATPEVRVGKNTTNNLPAANLATNAVSGRGSPAVASVSPVSAMTGSVSIAGPNVVYIPAANFVGTDTFRCVLSDGSGSIEGPVTVVVTNEAAPPPPAPGGMRTVALSAGNVLASFTGTVGASYVLQMATNLAPEPVTWLELQTNVAAAPDGLILMTNAPTATPATRFYRTVAS